MGIASKKLHYVLGYLCLAGNRWRTNAQLWEVKVSTKEDEMAHNFLLTDRSGRGISTTVDIDHVLKFFGDMLTDGDFDYRPVSDWAMGASIAQSIEVHEERLELTALDSNQETRYKVRASYWFDIKEDAVKFADQVRRIADEQNCNGTVVS
jgi:hypothetical protein